MNKLLPLAIGVFVLISGCKSTPDYRKVTEAELSDYKQMISDLSEGTYNSYWVQIGNKKEKCEILMEGYDFAGQPKNNINSEDMHWDGQCKNGKSHGLGKMTVNAGSFDWYEIAYHNEGITDRHYFRGAVGNNNVQYGLYLRENGKSVGLYEVQATVDSDGNIENNYAFVNVDSKLALRNGIITRKGANGSNAKYTGLVGNKLFFGTLEAFDVNSNPTWTTWGYINMATNKPESYVALKNNHGFWHQFYEFGNLKENVQLPKSYTNEIMKISANAATVANNVSSAGQLALSMKKKYDASNSAIVSKPKKPTPEKSRGISTGTGFFISNDGYVLTNSHVIEGSSNISIILNGKSVSASLIDHDSSNDIALLKVEKPVEGLSIELKKKTKQGTEIAVLGYPNIGLQGNEQKATFGFINANSGIQGDTRYFQISSPIQPGNSGSPMVNEKGVVIGIASASLNQTAAIKSTGTLAQNVNYAVKIAYALPMLINHGVEYIEPVGQKTLEKTALIESISNSVVLVVAE